MGVPKEAIEHYLDIVPGNLKVTKSALSTIEEAHASGVNEGLIYKTVAKAAVVALEQGRTKLGNFGPQRDVFDSIRGVSYAGSSRAATKRAQRQSR